MSEKTFIAVLNRGGVPCYISGTKKTEQYSTEKDGNIATGTRITRETAWTQETTWGAKDPVAPTDYFGAVCEKFAPVLVYRALKTVYQKEATEKIRLLMNECVAIAKTHSYAQYEYMESIKEVAKDDKERKTAESMTLQEVKHHRYKQVKGADGKSRRVECVPYDTLENTSFGKEVNANMGLAGGCDVYDLLQCADLAMLDLYYFGLIHKPTDIFESADYIFKRVNALIRAERTQAIKCDSIDYMTDDGEVMQITDKQADRMIANIDRDVTISAMSEYLLKVADKRTKMDDYSKFVPLFVSGMGDTEISMKTGILREQCGRYRAKAGKALQSSGMYEVLRSLVSIG